MMASSEQTADLLLERAARCYRDAGWTLDACRCYESVGQAVEAARLYESGGFFADAARAFTAAQEFTMAAGCFLRAREPGNAAEAWIAAGNALEAAWVLADLLQRDERARRLVQDLDLASPEDSATRELILARCEAAAKDPKPAARRLRQVLDRLGELVPGQGRSELELRALAVASALARPDLEVLVHAAATRHGSRGAASRWEAWAMATLGDASGVPLEKELHLPGGENEP
jgi:hypothetical protein